MEAYDRKDGKEQVVRPDIERLEEDISKEERALLWCIDGKCNVDVMCLL